MSLPSSFEGCPEATSLVSVEDRLKLLGGARAHVMRRPPTRSYVQTVLGSGSEVECSELSGVYPEVE